MEEKHKFLLLFNFVLFPIVMLIFSVLTFQGTDTHIEYVDSVSPVCPNDGYIKKDKFCYVADCFTDIDTCDKIPVTCPAGKYLNNNDDQCYTMLQYSDPVEPECPKGYFQATDVCLPNDISIEEHEQRKTTLRCKDGRVLYRYRCFLMSELIEQSCQEDQKKKKSALDKSSNTCNISNKSEETFTKAGKCSSSTRNCVANTSEEQVSLNNKCYKEKRIFVNA